jgi:hypothetical protein
MEPRGGTKFRARAPVDQTTSTVRAVRSTVAGAARARWATTDCPAVGSRSGAAGRSGAASLPPGSLMSVMLVS